MERATKIEKTIECIIGIVFLIPPILGVLSFLICLFGGDGSFARMRELEGEWSWHGENSTSTAPIYLGLMALAGAYMIKDCFRFFFVSKK